MSHVGRGRGYTGRYQVRERRPGDDEEADAARALAELSPRNTDPAKIEAIEKGEMEAEKEEVKPEKRSEDDAKIIRGLLRVDEQYIPLLALLEQFSPGEDGIQFNIKLRHFEATVQSVCTDETRLQQAFATFRAAALMNPQTTRKLAAVGASFTRQERQQVLRTALLNVVMQGTFAHLEVLQRSNPLFLINAANLMGEYFFEARLSNGNKVHILAAPLLQYMRALLASDDIRAHRSLAVQLLQNGRELMTVLDKELDDLSIAIRMRLLSPPPVSTIWLLLSSDICLKKFLPLPNNLQQFYAAQFELAPEDNYTEVNYGSWKKTPEKDGQRSDTSQDANEKVAHSLSQVSLNSSDEGKPKLRPILGAGAGLMRQEQSVSVSQDSFDTWKAGAKTLSKRFDLNTWRQQDEDKKEEEFNQVVIPPPPNFTVPDYPPPRFYPDNPNYLQQGDGAYINNQFPNVNMNQQGDTYQFQERPPVPPPERTVTEIVNAEAAPAPERVNNEMQKASSRRPVENWRKEKTEVKEDPNKNRQRNSQWTRRKSKESINEDDRSASGSSRDFSRSSNPRQNRRNSEAEGSESGKTPPRRHASDVPRSHKYWDHDDRCDRDYNS